MHNMQNMDVALLFCIYFCIYMQAFAYWCIYMQNNMQNMSNNMQAQNPICRIVQRSYFAYWSYICTPDFADECSWCLSESVKSFIDVFYHQIRNGIRGYTARAPPLSRGGRVRTGDQTISSPTPWPFGHDIPVYTSIYCYILCLSMKNRNFVWRSTVTYHVIPSM